MTSFVNADPAVPGRLLGLVPGRSGACVKGWLALQDKAFRDGIEVAVIDPSAPYSSGIRAALPNARIAVDHWHLVKLGNDMVTEVRQRASRERHGRRGRTTDAAWAHRRLLLTAGDRLSVKQLDRLTEMLAADDPTDEIGGAAWGCKERLRMLLASPADSWVLRDPAVGVLPRLRRRRHARDHPAGQHHRDLVAAHPGGPPAARRHQRKDRRLQPDHQTGQARRLAATGTWTTTNGVSSPTSHSTEQRDRKHEQAHHAPRKVEEPLSRSAQCRRNLQQLAAQGP
jgi:hypothetical protein